MKLVLIGVAALFLGAVGGWFAKDGVKVGAKDGSAINASSTVAGSAPAVPKLASDAALPELVAAVQGLASVVEDHADTQAAIGARLDDLEESLNRVEVSPAPEVVDATAESAEGALSERESLRRRMRDPEQRAAAQRERLVKAGFAPSEAEEIIAAVDSASLQRLELRYEAARAGNMNSAEYREAMRELPSARDLVRDEYGEDAYDKYLYAMGRPNRVIVDGVLSNSAAADAGLQAGDTVIDFAGERVYGTRDLMSIASQGSPDEMVPVRVSRDGNVYEYYVPRGPLGVNTRRGYEQPPDVAE